MCFFFLNKRKVLTWSTWRQVEREEGVGEVHEADMVTGDPHLGIRVNYRLGGVDLAVGGV